MIKASALFYALVISLLAAMLAGSLILSAYFLREETDECMIQSRMQVNALSGITYMLSSNDDVSGVKEIDLYDSGSDSVMLEKKEWGAYEALLSKAVWHGQEIKAAALAGSMMEEKDRYALYLADQDRPLSLAGSTKIVGAAYLPKAGVQRAYIEGQSYSGSQLIYGDVRASNKAIAPLDKALAERLTNILEGKFTGDDSIADVLSCDSLERSFFDTPVILRSNELVILSGKRFSGQVIIASGTAIVVKKDADLDGVILAAPIIRIEDKFEGAVQVFASDTLRVGKGCRLLYPSVAGIIRTGRSCNNMLLEVVDDAIVKGAVLSWQNKFDIRQSLLVSIAKGTTVTGHVYSTGLLDLKGKVNGSVTAAKLLLRTPSSVYENHLLNAVIDISKISQQFGKPVTAGTNKVVIKWLQ
jgi:cytoskeletal protein CcmA (bactofilin family)